MFGKKFRKGPTIDEPYYVEILPGSLDLKNSIIKSALNESGDLAKHWPKATLEEVNQFLAKLKQNYVIASGHNIELEQLQFIINNDENGVCPTGLTWEDPVINLSFDNFVISTIESTFNDRNSRLSDDIEYEDFYAATNQLLEFARKLTTLSDDDLPIIPSEEIYNQALRKNSDITIEPARLQRKSLEKPVEALANENLVIPEENKVVNSNVDRSVNSTAPELVMDPSGVVAPSGVDNSKHISENNIKRNINHNMKNNIKDNSKKSRVIKNDAVENKAISIIDHINLDTPQFKVEDKKIGDFPEDHDNFVVAEVAKNKHEANSVLLATKDELLAASKAKLTNVASQETQKFNKSLEDMIKSDWQKPILEKSAKQISEKFKKQYQDEMDSLKEHFQQLQNAENRRHEDTLKSIDSEQKSKVRETENRLQNSESMEIKKAEENAVALIKQEIDESMNVLKKNFLDKLTLQLNESAFQLNKDNSEILNQMFTELNEQIDQNKSELTGKHESAVQEKTKMLKQQNQENDFEKLQQQLNATEQGKNSLSNQLANTKKELDAKTIDLQTTISRFTAVQEEATRANNRIMELTSEKNQTMMAAAFSKMDDKPVETKKDYGFMKGVLVSSLIAVTLGGVWFTAWKFNEQNVRINQATAAESSMQSKLEANQKSVKEDKSKKATNNDNDSKDNNELNETSADNITSNNTSMKPDSYFSNLDSSIRNHSLDTYDLYYKNMNLGKSNRVLAVGKLLVSHNRSSDALALANANQGHNQELLQYIAAGTPSETK